MKINTLIIDDDPNWQLIIAKFVKMTPILELVATCESAMEGYAQMAAHEIDLLICDIEMPELSGLDFVKSLQSPPLVIFVTSHPNHALDCYDVSPLDFILKPLEQGRFLKSIEKAKKRLIAPENDDTIHPYFFVREHSNYVQITYKEVLYMRAQENFLQIVTKDKVYLPALSIVKMEEQLKGDIFLRVHRSFLVNRAAIEFISKNEIVLSSGQTIPIGDQYRTQINRKHLDGKIISRNS